MRNSSPLLSALLSPLTQRVLAATVLQAQREWYLSDLASHLRVSPSSLQRTMAQLTEAGILLRRKDRQRVYYMADPSCPILPELSGLLMKTVGIAEPVRTALAPMAGKIRLAFIHGSMAESRERSGSDVDLIIVGNASSADLALALRSLREPLGREVNFTRYSPAEFAAKVAQGHPFLASVLRKPKIFLIGDEHELEEAAGRQTHRPRAAKQARA